MKHRSRFLQFLLYGIMISGFVGCESPNTQKQSYETLVFKVDETQLEPIVTDTTLRIKIAAPKDWKKIDDAMLQQVTSKLDTQRIQGIRKVMLPIPSVLKVSLSGKEIPTRMLSLTRLLQLNSTLRLLVQKPLNSKNLF